MKHYITLFITYVSVIIFIGQALALQETEILNLDKAGAALSGYDPVSYHDGMPVKGKGSMYFIHNGAKYLFISKENRSRFITSPLRFAPAFGGWCAWAMLEGKKVNVDPERYKIVDGKTYLFYNSFFTDTLKKWNGLALKQSESALTGRAKNHWKKISGQ